MNAWNSIAELKIARAQREGRFDDLPGFGRPIPGIDAGFDENGWLREKLRFEDLRVVPPAWELRIWARERTDAMLALPDDSSLREAVAVFNAELSTRLKKVLWGPPADVAPIDAESLVARWRSTRVEAHPIPD